MTPGVFEYHRPASVDEAVGLLERYGDDAKILAGGHSLIPMMKLRLAEPAHLIDINGIDDLKGIGEKNDEIVIGAATTQAEVLFSDLLASKCPVLPETAALIADPQVRNCGTAGGNCANGDPGNDYPAVMMALGAGYTLKSTGSERHVAATDFYRGVYETALAENEILTAIHIPTPAAGTGAAYQKLKRKVGDFAIAAAAVTLSMDGETCSGATVALTNVADKPFCSAAAAAALKGSTVDDAAINAAAEKAMAECNPADDLRGPAAYRTQMAGEMTRRAIRDALSRARGS